MFSHCTQNIYMHIYMHCPILVNFTTIVSDTPDLTLLIPPSPSTIRSVPFCLHYREAPAQERGVDSVPTTGRAVFRPAWVFLPPPLIHPSK